MKQMKISIKSNKYCMKKFYLVTNLITPDSCHGIFLVEITRFKGKCLVMVTTLFMLCCFFHRYFEHQVILIPRVGQTIKINRYDIDPCSAGRKNSKFDCVFSSNLEALLHCTLKDYQIFMNL